MKLKNKKTGEIVEITIPIKNGDGWNISANSLSELNEEWCDYEEPEGYWFIDCYSVGVESVTNNDDSVDKFNKEIGNYFETEEEAEKAVEKLKAWKRLKDKGFRFGRWQFLDDRSGIWVKGNLVPDIVDELDLLFGGEE